MKKPRQSKAWMERKYLTPWWRAAASLELLALRLRGAYRSRRSVSLCTTVKDRFEHLVQTFPRNIRDNEAYGNCEFLLLDYQCPDPRTRKWVEEELGPYIDRGMVNYYYYPHGQTFHISHARNLAFRLARGDILCSVDADTFLGRGFVAYASAVLSRDCMFIRASKYSNLAGRICIRRQHFEAVGGFDERFTGWGVEDEDFADRLRMTGLQEKRVAHLRFRKSISHEDELRTRYYTKDKETSLRDNKALAAENARLRVLRPNGEDFGHGRVQKNFTEWIDV